MSFIKTVFPIAALFSFRMLGLFMLIPVFTVYAGQLTGSTPTLIGVALGAYGLSQGLLQIPFGLLSDRLGRKPMLTTGLLLFALGSLLGAQTHSIWGMIIARTLQGTGAIGGVLIALLSDLTSEKERTKSMAVIGMTIGLSFGLAMIISPLITHHFGLAGIFYLTVSLALAGLLMVHTLIPTPKHNYFHADTEANPSLIKTVMTDLNLQRFNASIFFQHCLFTSTFYVTPLLIKKQIQLNQLSQAWHFYLPMMLVSFLLMMPLIIIGEKKNRIKTLFLTAITTTFFAQLILIFTHAEWPIFCFFMLLYLIAFNFLEATLPSLISKQVKSAMRGTAMGVYSSSQFLGIFVGGTLAGIFYSIGGSSTIFCLNSVVALIWLCIAWSIKIRSRQSLV